MKRSLAFATLMIAILLSPKVNAQSGKIIEDSADLFRKAIAMDQAFNVPLKTTGGTQLWTDHCDRDGLRIQQNALTGHWRLLDSHDVRQAWGTRQACEAKLGELCIAAESLSTPTPSPGSAPGNTNAAPRHAVVMLHGLMRTRHSMKTLAQSLADKGSADGGEPIQTIRFSYASTRSSIGDHAAALREVLESQPSSTQFSFVGHSMGNIVVRHLIGDLKRDGDPQNILPRCRSMVMLGPPNQGAAIARRLAPTKLYGWVTGAGGMELGPGWEAFSANLATPDFPFLIIAGDVSGSTVQNPLVDGSSDFVVSVDEAKLDGSVAVETFPVLHSFLMNDAAVVERTVDFLTSH